MGILFSNIQEETLIAEPFTKILAHPLLASPHIIARPAKVGRIRLGWDYNTRKYHRRLFTGLVIIPTIIWDTIWKEYKLECYWETQSTEVHIAISSKYNRAQSTVNRNNAVPPKLTSGVKNLMKS